MSSPTPLVRQEHIRSLRALAGILAHAETPATAPASSPAAPRLRPAISAECVQCGIRLTGDELLQLADASDGSATDDRAAASSSPPNPKVARLRLGYCARGGCDSCYYRVTFEEVPGIDWRKLLPGAELEITDVAPAEDPALAERRAAVRASSRRTAGRAALVIVGVALLLLARHWYQGGTIPYLREPEEFDVQIAPPPVASGHRPPG